MFRKYLTVLLFILIVNLSCSASPFVSAANGKSRDVKFAENAKSKLLKLGTGKDTQISVKLKDGTKVQGQLSEISDDFFVVTNTETGAATTIAYSKAKQIKGNNLSTGAKFAIGIGIFTLIIIALIISKSA